jgi:hypothetical protein
MTGVNVTNRSTAGNDDKQDRWSSQKRLEITAE